LEPDEGACFRDSETALALALKADRDSYAPLRPQGVHCPGGGDAWGPANPRTCETLIRALARAHRWKRLLEEDRCRSAGKIAEAEQVSRSFVNRLLRLTLLAPDIVEAILQGRQPKAMQLQELTDAIPSEWEKQRKAHLSGAA
jgi:hypothetical protein